MSKASRRAYGTASSTGVIQTQADQAYNVIVNSTKPLTIPEIQDVIFPPGVKRTWSIQSTVSELWQDGEIDIVGTQMNGRYERSLYAVPSTPNKTSVGVARRLKMAQERIKNAVKREAKLQAYMKELLIIGD